MARHSARAPSVVVPGNHDGVHLGHQALLRRACAHAQAQGARVIALTFDPHPAVVLAPERAPAALTTLERRSALLTAFGVNEVVIEPFTREFASQSPSAYVQRLQGLGACALVVGPDFRFGKDRAGDVAWLRARAEEEQLAVLVQEPVEVEGARVSSSRVREAVAAGDVALASRLLGRVHDVDGEVIEGQRRGRQLGFPTANLALPSTLQPADGVYAVIARLELDSEPLRGVANIGVRPTLEAGRSLEVHLFDFAGDVYGRTLRVGFVERLRGEQRFDGVDALRARITLDCERARTVLEGADRGAWQWI
jgi:riboflavin kinase/FMN adenylyltransferase